MIREASKMGPDSCVVTWLPVYHDMGLIGTVLNAITLPCELVVIPPIVFLKNPRLWLELITRFHGTHTAAPNFAYGLCVRRVEHTQGLDLGSMTTFICGAEPVMARTMEDFVGFYRDAGLKAGAMVPAYGLAEATLAVTFTEYMRGLTAEEIELESLSAGRLAKPAIGEERSLRICACGVPLSGLSVRIASENDELLADRQIGEIQIAGSSVSPGYIGDDDATHTARTGDGWLRTGDLGYMAGGELYPCGRIKDIIIIRGKNFHAHDLESAASEVKGIRTGNVVAFSSRDEGGEALVIVAETKLEGKNEELSREIRSHLAQTIGIAPDDVAVVPAGTLPKTSSGKLKRLETRSSYLSGKLGSRPGALTAIGAALASRIGFLRSKS
jgi:fatty-acyl-CoA synthase